VDYTEPQYSPLQADDAGQKLVELVYPVAGDFDDPRDWSEAYSRKLFEHDEILDIVNNWRSAHSFPLNTFQVTLKKRAHHLDSNALVAQRIKRLSSIEKKLRRYPDLKLSEMQDLGGCRAVVHSISAVHALVNSYDQGLKHRLERSDDYIAQPKGSGYRGVHLVYSYRSDRRDIYNGLRIEIQIRSTLQHYWATAVENVDTFTDQDLKSGVGQSKWRRFFSLMGTVIANIEGTAIVPNTSPNASSVKNELQKLVAKLDIVNRLQAYNATLKHINEQHIINAHYWRVKREPRQNRVVVSGFKSNEPERATEAYNKAERLLKLEEVEDVVLVAAESMKSLMLAYPNYFADTHRFIAILNRALA
jgi:ppGpp synthetase/RelA/SpoT-type nucleotidyltranferase